MRLGVAPEAVGHKADVRVGGAGRLREEQTTMPHGGEGGHPHGGPQPHGHQMAAPRVTSVVEPSCTCTTGRVRERERARLVAWLLVLMLSIAVPY